MVKGISLTIASTSSNSTNGRSRNSSNLGWAIRRTSNRASRGGHHWAQSYLRTHRRHNSSHNLAPSTGRLISKDVIDSWPAGELGSVIPCSFCHHLLNSSKNCNHWKFVSKADKRSCTSNNSKRMGSLMPVFCSNWPLSVPKGWGPEELVFAISSVSDIYQERKEELPWCVFRHLTASSTITLGKSEHTSDIIWW